MNSRSLPHSYDMLDDDVSLGELRDGETERIRIHITEVMVRTKTITILRSKLPRAPQRKPLSHGRFTMNDPRINDPRFRKNYRNN